MKQKYSKVNKTDVIFFIKTVGKMNVHIDNETLKAYSTDHTENLSFLPEIVVKPITSTEISNILKYCNDKLIPITPCGARTGLSGGSLPVYGGVMVSTERLNKIIDLDERNLQATVEPGVINRVFKDYVEKAGLFYPPDPASQGSCFLGGNLAENAGGPKALKYGVTKDYVLNLEIVLTSGEIIWTGANVLKNSTGYNLTQLMIGSEGTLGIITKVVFKLIPLPKKSITLLVPFKSAELACEAVSAIFMAGLNPCSLEFMERDAIDWTLEYSDIKLEIKDHVRAHLLIEVDGNDEDILYKECEEIEKVVKNFDCDDVILADNDAHKNSLWKLRRSVGEAVKANSIYKEEDTVVPRAELPILLKGVKEIGKEYGFKSVCYGHAGDGNLHINIIKGEMSDHKWNNLLTEAIRKIFTLTVKLGGTISGEHGIGYVQKEYIDIAFSKKAIDLQIGIKNIFDPNNILNPGKIFK